MKYMGSKSRIKKYVVPILQELIDRHKIKNTFIRFCGGCNIEDELECENIYSNDISEPLIELLKHVQVGGELPESVSKELYDDVRSNKDTDKYEKWYIGAIGYLASYNGRYFDGGYAGITHTKANTVRDYYSEAKRNLQEQSSNLKEIKFSCGDYREVEIPDGSLVYCDPPYDGTKQYGICRNFNHKVFWDWVREQSKTSIVLVSEENAPSDFICIWEQEVTRTQNNRDRGTATEKLFIHKDIQEIVFQCLPFSLSH